MSDQDLEIAKAAFAANELEHAVKHLAWYLSENPRSLEARELLAYAIARAPDPLALAPLTPPQTPYAIVAVRAYILAGQGDLAQALNLMGNIYRVIPNLPFLPWVAEWLSVPERLNPLPPARLGFLLQGIVQSLTPANEAQIAAALRERLPVLMQYQAGHLDDPALAGTLSILLRKMGRVEEAIRVAQASFAHSPDYWPAIAWAGALRAKGDLPGAVVAFREALRCQPDSLAVMLDLGDLLCELGSISEGIQFYRQALDREPAHAWALPSYLYYMQYVQAQGDWPAQFQTYVEKNPENTRARVLQRGAVPYVTYLPEPDDATTNIFRQVFVGQTTLKPITLGLSSLESPSARLAIELFQSEKFGQTNLTVQVADIQKPDPRVPRKRVDFVLWKYRGTDPLPAYPPPAKLVSQTISELARRPYHLEAWFSDAATAAQQLGQKSLPEVLGAMVHPPSRPEPITYWDWVHRVQFAATLVIARLDDGWDKSVRRKALLALVYGPMDWTVEAAIVVLAHVARTESSAVKEIGQVYLDLFRWLPRPGGVPYEFALVASALRLPTLSAELRQKVEQARAELSQS